MNKERPNKTDTLVPIVSDFREIQKERQFYLPQTLIGNTLGNDDRFKIENISRVYKSTTGDNLPPEIIEAGIDLTKMESIVLLGIFKAIRDKNIDYSGESIVLNIGRRELARHCFEEESRHTLSEVHNCLVSLSMKSGLLIDERLIYKGKEPVKIRRGDKREPWQGQAKYRTELALIIGTFLTLEIKKDTNSPEGGFPLNYRIHLSPALSRPYNEKRVISFLERWVKHDREVSKYAGNFRRFIVDQMNKKHRKRENPPTIQYHWKTIADKIKLDPIYKRDPKRAYNILREIYEEFKKQGLLLEYEREPYGKSSRDKLILNSESFPLKNQKELNPGENN